MTTQHSNTTGVDMAAGVPTDDSSGGGSSISDEAALDSPEQLRREAVPGQQQPELLLPPALQQHSGKSPLARAPAVDMLSMLVDCKYGDTAMSLTCLEDCLSRNTEEVNQDKSSKMRKVMTSTMMGEEEQEIIMEDISVIQSRKSVDPRISSEPRNKYEAVMSESEIVKEGLCDNQDQYAAALSLFRAAASALSDPSSAAIEIPESEAESVVDSPHICQYPRQPHPGRICVRLPDYLTLAEGTFLNDIIIDFYLSYLLGEKLTPSRRENIHIFSSHFFKRLSVHPVEGSMMANMEKMSKLPLVQIRHMRVQNWTKSSNLTEKKLVIFPICKNSHWFLVLAVLASEKYLLVVMDSLGGDNMEDVNMIKEYLIIELNCRPQDKKVNPEDIKIVRPSLPQQDNFTDCGVFLLHYAEKVLERPDLFLSYEDQDLTDLFTKSEVDRKRSNLARLIRQMSEEQTHSVERPDPPDLFGDDQYDHVDERQVNHLETEEMVVPSDDLRQLIQSELANLSLPTPITMDKNCALSAIEVPSTAALVPSPASRRASAGRKKSKIVPQLSLYTQAEYYRGKPASERKFDDLLEDEVRGNTRWRVGQGRKRVKLSDASNVM